MLYGSKYLENVIAISRVVSEIQTFTRFTDGRTAQGFQHYIILVTRDSGPFLIINKDFKGPIFN